jgi:hypothetical protein
MPFETSSIKNLIYGLAKPALGAVRYALTLILFSGLWWYDARLLNWAFDVNLALIKAVTGVFDGSGKAEAMMRAFAAEKMLLFGEGSAIIWALGTLAAKGLRRVFSRPDSAWTRSGPAASSPEQRADLRRSGGKR